MKKWLIGSLIILTFWTSLTTMGQDFNRFLTRIGNVSLSQRQAIADSFMSAVTTLPYHENDTTVFFLYAGDAQTLSMAGDATGWQPSDNFEKVEGCDLWYYKAIYEADARLDYKLVMNGTNWILDPGNPKTCPSGFGENSELRMPGNMIPADIREYAVSPGGTLSDTIFHSAFLGDSRKVSIYLPVGYRNGDNRYPVVLFHDGPDYLKICKADKILDDLISKKMMAPVVAVFVPPVDRTAEYSGLWKDTFAQFIIKELMPALDLRLRLKPEVTERAMIGASDGGNISLFIGVKYPGSFGKIAVQSSNVIPEVTETIEKSAPLPLVFYIDIGKYDIDVLIPMAYNLRDQLNKKGYRFEFRKWNEGHSWGNWKEHLRFPLSFFFPYSTGKEKSE